MPNPRNAIDIFRDLWTKTIGSGPCINAEGVMVGERRMLILVASDEMATAVAQSLTHSYPDGVLNHDEGSDA